MDCIFCDIIEGKRTCEKICEYNNCIAIYDEYPVSPGHALIIPKRHVTNINELNKDEYEDLWNCINWVTSLTQDCEECDGFNIGINIGKAAGQTIDHLHIHVIPRYTGDVENPQGGIRGVIPNKQHY